MQGVQRVAGDHPVRPGPDQRRGERPASASQGARRASARRRPHPAASKAATRTHASGRSRPGDGEHDAAPRRRGAGARASSSTAPTIERRERDVLVGEQRVALERGAGEHDERGDDADPRARTAPRPSAYARYTSAPKASRTRPRSTSSEASPNGSASRLNAVCSGCGVGAKSAVYSGAWPCDEVARPQQRVARVVVEEPRAVDEVQQRGDRHGRIARGREPRRPPGPRPGGGGGGHRARTIAAVRGTGYGCPRDVARSSRSPRRPGRGGARRRRARRPPSWCSATRACARRRCSPRWRCPRLAVATLEGDSLSEHAAAAGAAPPARGLVGAGRPRGDAAPPPAR